MRSVRRRCNICSTTWRMWSGWLFRLRCGNSPELRRKDYLVTNWLERFAHERLAHVRPVRLSRVEERHPEVVRTSNDVDVVVGVDGSPQLALRPVQPSPIAENLQGTCSELRSSCLYFLRAERVRWLCSLPEDATVLTVVLGVVVSVELIRRRPATVLATPRVHLPILWSWLASGDKGRARPRADGSSAGLRLSSAQFVSVPRWCAARSVCRVPIGIAERQRRVGPVPIARRSGSPCLAVCSGSLPG
jgi:hypothetical protein